MANRTWYIYNPNRMLSPAERRVRDEGFPYVSTTILVGRNQIGPDHLNDHSHHSRNTHLIVQGSITLAKARGDGFRVRPRTFRVGEWANMDAGALYRGEAGDEGCVFVEGHAVLSPTTAERFEKRGTIVPVKKWMYGAFRTS